MTSSCAAMRRHHECRRLVQAELDKTGRITSERAAALLGLSLRGGCRVLRDMTAAGFLRREGGWRNYSYVSVRVVAVPPPRRVETGHLQAFLSGRA